MENNLNKVNIINSKNKLKSVFYDDFYFNSNDPIGEVNYVYIEGNFLNIFLYFFSSEDNPSIGFNNST